MFGSVFFIFGLFIESSSLFVGLFLISICFIVCVWFIGCSSLYVFGWFGLVCLGLFGSICLGSSVCLGLVSFGLVWLIVVRVGSSIYLCIACLVQFGLIWIRLVQFVWLLGESR